MKLCIVTTGGTIDKVYFDAKSDYEIGESQVPQILHEASADLDWEVIGLLRKDSLELTDEDRALVRATISARSESYFLVTHGTDTMVETAKALAGLEGKTIVLTGSLSPARFRNSDAVFNVGLAIAALQTCDHGVWIAMNGRIFHPDHVRKNRERNCFEEISA